MSRQRFRIYRSFFLIQESEGSEYSITLGEMRLVNAGESELTSPADHEYTSSLTLENPLISQVEN